MVEKITGLERQEELPEKVLLLYRAVLELIVEGEDMNNVKVSVITGRAGIGKGTAYDYFESKEEIIASAIAFHVKKMTEEIHEGLGKEDTFPGQMAYLMDRMEEKAGDQSCFIHFVHMMTDHSSIGQKLHHKMNQEQIEAFLPLNVLKKVLLEGMEKGRIRSDLPVEYIMFSICARMVSYMAAIGTCGSASPDYRKLRPYIYQGILNEFMV